MTDKVRNKIQFVLNTFHIGMKLYVKQENTVEYILSAIDIRIVSDDVVDIFFYLDANKKNKRSIDIVLTLKHYNDKFFISPDLKEDDNILLKYII